MGKKGSYKHWVDYYISMHMGFCHGPVDSIQGVFIKEKAVLDEGQEMDVNGFVEISKPNLFGGNEREGGAVGRMHYLSGDTAQLIPPEFAERLKLTPETAPGFRGLASLIFLGTGGKGGFNVSSNYPSVPGIWARFRRASVTMSPGNAVIVSRDGKRHNSNPAHIIHECLVNKKWGMGGEPSQLNADSFNLAADTLFNEKFGLSMKWVSSSSIESFIQEVINHIKALFFFNPWTGLGELKLLRDDYDPNNLEELGPSNAELISFRRKLWGETSNEIVVSWTNPETEEEETVTYQDLGNISMQGGVVSESRNYYGAREVELGAEIAMRDIVEISQPLASAKVRVDRRNSKLLPGAVVKFTWPKHNIETVIMRVMDADYGKPADSKITLSLLEDVFGLPSAEFTYPPTGEWEDPAQDPNGENMQLPVKFVAAPYPLITRAVGDEIGDDEYPGIIIAALATPTEEQTDVHSFFLNGEGALPNGDPVWTNLGEKQTTGQSTLAVALPQEVTSDILIGEIIGVTGPELSGLALIGDDDMDETEMELVMFDTDLGNGAWRIARGIFDTVPHAWAAGTKIWFIDTSFNAFDPSVRIADAPHDYKLQPRTSIGIMDIELATIRTTSHLPRPYLPFRPANVKVNATPFGLEDMSEDHEPRKWLIDITWSNRNRKTEDTIFRRWDETTTAPEPGQTTSILITTLDAQGEEVVSRIDGLEGTSYALEVEDTAQQTNLMIKVISRRDDFESLQGLEIGLTLYRKGYGSDWNFYYGGWPETMTFPNAAFVDATFPAFGSVSPEGVVSGATFPAFSAAGTVEII